VTDLALNPVDAAVLVLIAVAAWFGYRAGFVATMYSLASWVLAVAAALAFAGPATTFIETLAGFPKPLAATIAFVVTIVAAEALLSAAGYLAIRPIVALIRRSPLSIADRMLGTVPAAIRSLFIVAVAILAIEALPLGSDVKAAVEASRAGRVVNAEIVAFSHRSNPSPDTSGARHFSSLELERTRLSNSTSPMGSSSPRTWSRSASSSIW